MPKVTSQEAVDLGFEPRLLTETVGSLMYALPRYTILPLGMEAASGPLRCHVTIALSILSSPCHPVVPGGLALPNNHNWRLWSQSSIQVTAL